MVERKTRDPRGCSVEAKPAPPCRQPDYRGPRHSALTRLASRVFRVCYVIRVTEILQTLTKFCFPFYVDSLTVSQVGQNFTFVLTDIDSKQRFGFCRLSSGAKACFCILSYLPWFEVFYKLLSILADYTAKGQDDHWHELLEALHQLPVPDPGTSVHLSVHSYFTVPDARDLPSIPENRNLTEYFVAVDVNNMLHLYASMLYERRVLICCSKLSTLTACVHGSAAMLYPMFWQHVYIPVLPPHLLDYCCAPMPYLIGVHLSLMERVRSMALDDVVILNVDTNTLETPFEDLQSLPNDVISALKTRLKKVSMTTGDGVARAFLKAQAAFFGSYRSALKIEPEEPITFCEEVFVAHRSTTMRQFLQNATQLQLFKQFIDGRLDLLNSGEGFSDVFEEEINMGEYAGSDRLYHQWLSTVKKGSGAILNTVKTKANPAMRTVYKFAKDHAKMGIKEVKNRLKQKDIAENGCPAVPEDSLPQTSPSPLAERREDRRPITAHFGQVRPPRPQVVRRPKSSAALDGRRTSVSSPEQPQPYRALKESDSAEGEDPPSPERPQDPFASDRPTELGLLEGIFCGLEVEPPPAAGLSHTKSLEDLRLPLAEGTQPGTFDYQRLDPGPSEPSWAAPGPRPPHPHKPPWGLGQDDMAIPSRGSPGSLERSRPAPAHLPPAPRRPRSGDGSGPQPAQGSITIPRPQGRKTPELGIVPPPPAPRAAKLQAPLEASPACLAGPCGDLAPEPGQEALAGRTFALDPAGPGPRQPPLLPTPGGLTELLQPVRVSVEPSSPSSDALLALLDPLKSGGPEPALQPSASPLLGPASSSPAAGFPSVAGDLRPFGRPLGYLSPVAAPPPGQAPSLSPFVQALPLSLARPPQSPFGPSLGHAYSSSILPPTSGFCPPLRSPSTPLALSMPNLFAQAAAAPPSRPPPRARAPQPAQRCGPSQIRTLPLPHSAARKEAQARLAARPCDLPLAPQRARVAEPGLPPAKPAAPKDPFEDLLSQTKPEVSLTPGKVEQLRRQWETFE
ncbi:hypothetical protein lerEdw1_010580 [Lerista edwardsae]|nr:hypothetical protein lerEdw1_010580 [Lerista edwardsae]